jgi:dienelactone hydrolase
MREAADTEVRVRAAGATLAGILTVPSGARGVVVFAHGSGSGRLSPRNRAVAQALVGRGFATLLLDLLTPQEEAEDLRTRRLRFDIGLLAQRVVGALDWLAERSDGGGDGGPPPGLADLPAGCFGASTGAAAALIAAAERPDRVRAAVSRGGRPDLAGPALARVTAPTLLIVGGEDPEVVRLNRLAQAMLGGD